MAIPRASRPNPRRFIITAAILVVAGILLFRDKMDRDWSRAAETSTRRLIDGDAVRPSDPALAVVHGVAIDAIGELEAPLVPGAAEVAGAGSDRQASIQVAGADGGRVTLTWRGDPPRLVDVKVTTAESGSADSNSNSGRDGST